MLDAVETGSFAAGEEALYRSRSTLHLAEGRCTASPAVAHQDAQRFADWWEDGVSLRRAGRAPQRRARRPAAPHPGRARTRDTAGQRADRRLASPPREDRGSRTIVGRRPIRSSAGARESTNDRWSSWDRCGPLADERPLAGKLAGALWLSVLPMVVVALVLPGATADRWVLVLAVTAPAALWDLPACCGSRGSGFRPRSCTTCRR